MDALLSILVSTGNGMPASAALSPVPMLAEFGNSSLLAIGLMIAGALVLRHAFRPKKDNDDPVLQQPGRVQPFSPAPNSSEPERDDLHEVMLEVKQLRTVLADETDRHAERLEVLIARAEETIRKLETLSPSDAMAARSAAARDPAPIDPLNRRIYELADQGLPPVDIARSLNQQTGKVELVLALRPR